MRKQTKSDIEQFSRNYLKKRFGVDCLIEVLMNEQTPSKSKIVYQHPERFLPVTCWYVQIKQHSKLSAPQLTREEVIAQTESLFDDSEGFNIISYDFTEELSHTIITYSHPERINPQHVEYYVLKRLESASSLNPKYKDGEIEELSKQYLSNLGHEFVKIIIDNGTDSLIEFKVENRTLPVSIIFGDLRLRSNESRPVRQGFISENECVHNAKKVLSEHKNTFIKIDYNKSEVNRSMIHYKSSNNIINEISYHTLMNEPSFIEKITLVSIKETLDDVFHNLGNGFKLVSVGDLQGGQTEITFRHPQRILPCTTTFYNLKHTNPKTGFNPKLTFDEVTAMGEDHARKHGTKFLGIVGKFNGYSTRLSFKYHDKIIEQTYPAILAGYTGFGGSGYKQHADIARVYVNMNHTKDGLNAGKTTQEFHKRLSKRNSSFKKIYKIEKFWENIMLIEFKTTGGVYGGEIASVLETLIHTEAKCGNRKDSVYMYDNGDGYRETFEVNYLDRVVDVINEYKKSYTHSVKTDILGLLE